MCLATAYRTDAPDSVILEYVSKVEIDGDKITLIDVLGDTKTVVGSLAMADLTGGVVRINCQD